MLGVCGFNLRDEEQWAHLRWAGEDCGRCRMGEVDLAGEGERWGVLPGLRRCTCCAICCLFKIGKMATLSPVRRLAGLQGECSMPLPGDEGEMRVEPVLQFGGRAGIAFEPALAAERLEADFGEGVSAGGEEADDVEGRLASRGEDDAGECRDMSTQLACFYRKHRPLKRPFTAAACAAAALRLRPEGVGAWSGSKLEPVLGSFCVSF
jgi:hypothetical protein